MAPLETVSFPPSDFAGRDLPLETIPAGTRLIRIHLNTRPPLHFGSTGRNRFDDPKKAYGVCYLAMSIEGAFAETCLRDVGAHLVALTFLEARSFSQIEVTTPLRLAALHGAGLARIGATSTVSSGAHGVAQRWSRAVHEHPAAPGGIAYRSNLDNGEICVAVFERVAGHLKPGAPQPITADRAKLAVLLARYDVGLG
ncbi:MAG: RES domain-containing protein [Alphaproteobacteria bacterium]|nr:RES domain-containing protein [Alphaproteobacteria bacterium]